MGQLEEPEVAEQEQVEEDEEQSYDGEDGQSYSCSFDELSTLESTSTATPTESPHSRPLTVAWSTPSPIPSIDKNTATSGSTKAMQFNNSDIGNKYGDNEAACYACDVERMAKEFGGDLHLKFKHTCMSSACLEKTSTSVTHSLHNGDKGSRQPDLQQQSLVSATTWQARSIEKQQKSTKEVTRKPAHIFTPLLCRNIEAICTDRPGNSLFANTVRNKGNRDMNSLWSDCTTPGVDDADADSLGLGISPRNYQMHRRCIS
jgi:hypothetical protein